MEATTATRGNGADGAAAPRLAAYKYPLYDLDSAIEVARKLKERSASYHELATFLGYSGVRNGAFVSRLAAARLFGLVEGPNSALHPSPRARLILQPDYPATEGRARLDAFRAVPLFAAFLREYEGKPLPETTGMQNALESRFGIVKKQAPMVLERLLDSAEQAGLFKAAGKRTKMIVPTFGDAPTSHEEPSGREVETPVSNGRHSSPRGSGAGGGTGGGGGGHQYPTLIAGALEQLPDGAPWNEDELHEWLDLFERVLRVVYKVPRAAAAHH